MVKEKQGRSPHAKVSHEPGALLALDCCTVSDDSSAWLSRDDAARRARGCCQARPAMCRARQVEPGAEQQLLSASANGSLAIWDLRRLGPKAKALATASHAYTCQSAYFAPDGALLTGRPRLPTTCTRVDLLGADRASLLRYVWSSQLLNLPFALRMGVHGHHRQAFV